MEANKSIGEKSVRHRPYRLLEGLLYSSVFISCCAFALAVETYLLAGLPVSLPMAAFIFLATLFTYNLSSLQSILRRPRQTLEIGRAHV